MYGRIRCGNRAASMVVLLLIKSTKLIERTFLFFLVFIISLFRGIRYKIRRHCKLLMDNLLLDKLSTSGGLGEINAISLPVDFQTRLWRENTL